MTASPNGELAVMENDRAREPGAERFLVAELPLPPFPCRDSGP
jgi:hypothetical protein